MAPVTWYTYTGLASIMTSALSKASVKGFNFSWWGQSFSSFLKQAVQPVHILSKSLGRKKFLCFSLQLFRQLSRYMAGRPLVALSVYNDDFHIQPPFPNIISRSYFRFLLSVSLVYISVNKGFPASFTENLFFNKSFQYQLIGGM